MSRHEGLSCDSCLKANFSGLRYKCLVCYDYDLCASCYESGSVSIEHNTSHPMQCILTRSDYDLFYGGEMLNGEQQSFTCPLCGKMGYTEDSLQEHVTANHADMAEEVVCPVCVCLPTGEPNFVTFDLASHLNLEHRSPGRNLVSFLDESASRGVRRIPAPSRGVTGRSRRPNTQLGSGGSSSMSPLARENMNPIAELLSQLSGAHRHQSSSSSPLQQLQMQLQLERHQIRRIERITRRPTATTAAGSKPVEKVESSEKLSLKKSPRASSSQFCLPSTLDLLMADIEQEKIEKERADKSIFVQELILSSLSDPPEKTPPLPGLTATSTNLWDDSTEPSSHQ